jgi:glutamate-1-semialdehyde 2,1-aminomutase
MPLGRFFRGKQAVPQEQEGGEPEVEAEEMAEAPDDEPALAPEWDASAAELERSWRARAAESIAGSTSTGSKSPAALFGEGNEHGPTHFVRANGCHVVTPTEVTLLDCTMALGSVAIGYGDERVMRAVGTAAALGHVSGLPHVLEVEVAERLCDVIPGAEQVRFFKSGGEAMSAAVRLARAATGRSIVVGCGYFGWQDWSHSGDGIPAGVSQDYRAIPFDDVPALQVAARAAGSDLAAIVIEPVIERMPSEDWAATARRLCDELGAVLVFDEMKTGFRLAHGGYQELSGVTPDLAAFGKAMANGFPLAAMVGSRAVMEAASRTWISSTLAGEALGLAAARAMLDIHDEEDDVCGILARAGGAMRDAVAAAVKASGIAGVTVDGLDQMWLMRFDDPVVERMFLEEAVAQGVLFKRGAYNYAAVAHDEEEILFEVERAASSAMVAVVDELDNR